MQINCPDGTLLESRELFWRIILNQYICILLHLAHYFIHPTCSEPWSEEFRYFFFLKILWYRQTFCIMYYTNRSNFCPLLISIFALFASDNLFVGDKELIFYLWNCFLSPQKRIIRRKQDQKTRAEVELGISKILELQWFSPNLFLFFIYSLLWRICLKCTNWTCLD